MWCQSCHSLTLVVRTTSLGGGQHNIGPMHGKSSLFQTSVLMDHVTFTGSHIVSSPNAWLHQSLGRQMVFTQYWTVKILFFFFPGVIWHYCGCCTRTLSLYQLHHGWLCLQLYKRHLQPSRRSPMPNPPSIQFIWLLESFSPAISPQLCATGSTAFDTPRLFPWSSCAGLRSPIHFESSAHSVFSGFGPC